MFLVRLLVGQRLYRCLMVMAISLPVLGSRALWAAENLAIVIADGKPWEMYVVKRNRSNILVFRAGGSGTVSDGVASVRATWKSLPEGICIRVAPAPEKCLQLTRTNEGIAGVQSGRIVWILKR